MQGNNLHEILICQTCGLRFPLSPTEKRMEACPRCGARLEMAELPYESFTVPIKNKTIEHVQFVSVLDNIRSAYNVGSIFRTSDGAGLTKIYLCGITPTPENPRVGKTALGAENYVPWEHSWSVIETIEKLKKEGNYIVSLEGGSTSINLFNALPIIREQKNPVTLIVGNEVSGIDPEAVKKSSLCVYIPMEGTKESLNVASAFAIASYLIRYQGIKNE